MHLSERRIAKMRLGGYESDGIPSYARRERGIISSIPPLNQKGFTLVEIMIVVAIIALLAAIAVPGFMRARKRSQASRILNDLRIIDSAVDQYAIENNKKTNFQRRIGPATLRKVLPYTTQAIVSSGRRMVHRR